MSLDSIGARLVYLRGSLSQREVARRVGVSQSTLARWELNKIAPDANELQRISKAFGVSSTWLLEGKGDRPQRGGKKDTTQAPHAATDVETLPRLPTHGVPGIEVGQLVEGRVMIGADDIVAIGRPASSLAVVRIESDAMVPTINAGDDVIVDITEKTLRSGIWLLVLGDELVAQRVQVQPDGSVVVLSDNRRYPPTEVPREKTGSLSVVGRVLRVRMKEL